MALLPGYRRRIRRRWRRWRRWGGERRVENAGEKRNGRCVRMMDRNSAIFSLFGKVLRMHCARRDANFTNDVTLFPAILRWSPTREVRFPETNNNFPHCALHLRCERREVSYCDVARS